jgi:hypothetical protein
MCLLLKQFLVSSAQQYEMRLKGIAISLERLINKIFMIYIEEILSFIPIVNLLYVPIVRELRKTFFG